MRTISSKSPEPSEIVPDLDLQSEIQETEDGDVWYLSTHGGRQMGIRDFLVGLRLDEVRSSRHVDS